MSHRVLIVDDSLTVRMDLHDAFAAHGFATVLCATGAEARTAFAGVDFDAAVLDLLLPDADGLDLLTELRKSPDRSGVVIVLLSAEDEVADRLAGLRTGADEYVGKPYDAGYLVGRVRQLLGDRPAPVDNRTTVLVVDDSTTFREQLRDLLEAEGYAVLTAPSGEDGLRTAADRRPQAIIVDGVMPGIDGATVIRRVRLDPALRDIPCILMTAADDYATELQMLDAGADDYVRSAAGGEALRAHVRTQIRRKQSHDESRRIREELMRRELDAAEERAARQLAETRAALVEELEWRNRELEAFSGSVSHDLRGPLQVISSFAEVMLDDEDEPLGDEARRRLTRIQAAALRMADLVESLLILARASRGQLRRTAFDLTATAWQVIAEVEARERDHKVSFTVQEGMTADADEGLVQVILENLVNNAVKFTRKVEHATVEIGCVAEKYFVRDNGAGFPAGQASELFRPFARLHKAEDFPGTGIGLTTVHRAVERHGGEIWAEGEDGCGATFWFTLPPAAAVPGERRTQPRRHG